MPCGLPRRIAIACTLLSTALLARPAAATASSTAASASTRASCPVTAAPPPPVDASEVPRPGEPSPQPPPIPPEPVGGPGMGTCAELTPPGAPPVPEDVNAATWIVADMDTGYVLGAKNPHGRERPASTIKVLTALTALRHLDPNDTIIGTQADAAQEGDEVGIQPGVRYTVQQVLTGMLLRSGNDAAHALAEKLGGVDQATHAMNETARSLGALDTHAATASGLDAPGMSTSAYDLALIFRAASRNPNFVAADTAPTTELPNRPGQPPIHVVNQNQLLRSYPGALGGKTGYTDDARHTYIGAAQRGGRRLEVVLLRGEKTPERLWKQGAELLDWGFARPPGASVGRLVDGLPQQRPSKASAPRMLPTQQSGGGDNAGLFGTVGAPLVMLSGAAAALVGVLALRRRRVKLAAAAQRSRSDE